MYRLSKKNKERIVNSLIPILVQIPIEDLDEIMITAQKEITYRFKRVNDPYNYIRYWIREARKLLNKKDFQEIFLELLHEHNHGHSGWVDIVRMVYESPRNTTEHNLSNKIWYTYAMIARGIIKSVSAEDLKKQKKDEFDVTSTDILQLCLERLGKNVPKDLMEVANTIK